MKTRFCFAIAGLLISSTALAQTQAGAQGSASTQASGSVSANDGGASVASGSEMNASLSKTVDAGKAKPGDEVTATVTQDVKHEGHVVIPRGSKLIGRVTEAKPRGAVAGSGSAAGSAGANAAGNAAGGASGAASGTASAAADVRSRLGVVFDRAVLRNGKEVPINATIQALASADAAASGGMRSTGGSMSGAGNAAGSAGSSSGGLLGGAGNAAGGAVSGAGSVAGSAGGAINSTVGNVGTSAGAVGGLTTTGRLTSGSRGVFGLKGFDIQQATAGSAQGSGSVITSSGRNVRLDSGTRMLLVTGANAATRSSETGTSGAADQEPATPGADKR